MHAGELELFATQDLIDELLRRTSFQGVIIHADGGAKTRHWDGERCFTVSHNTNLHTEEAGRLLSAIGDFITSRE